MALPKGKGIRKIVIDDIEYYWRIKTRTGINGSDDLICVVGIVEKPNQSFTFTIGSLKKEEQNDNWYHDKITPKSIKSAIEYANKNYNWANPQDTYVFLPD